MALVFTVPQLLDMSEGTVPEAFSGIVKSVSKPLTGTSKNREGGDENWQMQKVVITGEGKEIELVFDNRPEVPKGVVGSKVYVQAYLNKKNSLSGTKRASYKNTPQVKVFEGADVSFDGQPNAGGADNHQQPQQRTTAPENRQQSNGNATSGHATPNGSGPRQAPADQSAMTREQADAKRVGEIKTFNKRLAKAYAGFLRCFDAAYQLRSEVNERHKHEGGFSPDAAAIKEMATTLFIQSQGRNVNIADIEFFPMKPFHTYEKPTGDDGTHPPQSNQNTQRTGQPFNA